VFPQSAEQCRYFVELRLHYDIILNNIYQFHGYHLYIL